MKALVVVHVGVPVVVDAEVRNGHELEEQRVPYAVQQEGEIAGMGAWMASRWLSGVREPERAVVRTREAAVEFLLEPLP